MDAPGSFEFVSSLGVDAVLVRFRNGQEEAVLNLHKVKTPTFYMIQGLYFQGLMEFWGDNVLIVNKRPSLQSHVSDADLKGLRITTRARRSSSHQRACTLSGGRPWKKNLGSASSR
jgi:hypothetical protein